MLGDNIKIARKRARFSQRALAEKVGISHNSIFKYEKNMALPDSRKLIAISRALSIPIHDLFRESRIVLSEPKFRHPKNISIENKNKYLGVAENFFAKYVEIEQIINQCSIFQIGKYKVSNNEEIDQKAIELREIWNLGFDPINNLIEIVEENGIKVGLINGDNQFDAMVAWIDNDQQKPVVILNQNMPGDRQLFSLAHEIGHIVLDINTSSKIKTEQAAYRFAESFLMPGIAVNKEFGDKRSNIDLNELSLLKQKYGISMQVLLYRLYHQNIISGYKFRKCLEIFKLNGWDTIEPGEQIPSQKPARMKRMVFHAYSEDMISKAKVAELLGNNSIQQKEINACIN